MKDLAAATAGLRARLQALAQLLTTKGPDMVRDGAVVAGVSLVSYGTWLMHRPSGFIVCGVMLIVGAILAARGAPD